MNEHFIDALIFLMIHNNHHYGYHGFKDLTDQLSTGTS